MTIDHNIINSLMVWAQTQAPFVSTSVPFGGGRRRVRLEITTEPHRDGIGPYYTHRTICRVYLAEPRCEVEPGTNNVCTIPSEMQPIAETRIA
jgi:hypothetical protein